MFKHNRIYAVLLAVLAVIAALSAGLLLFLAGASTAGSVEIHLPAWSLVWVAVINFAYTLAIIITLCSRRLKPAAGLRLTRLLNWTLLPAFPGGTLAGAYGLWRVDKEGTHSQD